MDLSGVPEQYRDRISQDGAVANLDLLGWTDVPDWLGDLTNLTALNLRGNSLTHLPTWFANLTSLKVLNLRGNKFTDLPEWVGNLTSLTSLNLRVNRLALLPDSFGNLTNLVNVDLRGNRLAQLPSTIGCLTKLTTLDLRYNKLTEFPRQLADLLTNGVDLQADANPLREPLPELMGRGSLELATYLRSVEEVVAQYEAKLLVVGEGNVGKSSLIAALMGAPFIHGRLTTHGIEISSIRLPHPDLGLDMILRAWDFGGQEVYRVSHQFFFSQRALYLVVWHARQGQEQDEVEGWLRRIRLSVGDEAIALVVATHCRERLPDLDYPQLERIFFGMLAGSFEVDSIDGTGIQALRTAISENASKLPQMGQWISPRWTAAREAVLALAGTEPQIRYEKFIEICKQHRVIGDEIGTLAKLMHDLGLVIYYDEDNGLKDIVVLNPEWLTKAISYVLDDRPTTDAGGVLDHKRLGAIWQEREGGYPAEYHPYFLRLMEKFDVSYRLDDEARSLVPQLVPRQRPALPWYFGDILPSGYRTLALTCRLSDPAPGLVPWLTVRHHRAATGKHWRRGVFLRHPIDAYHSEALLELLRDNELSLEVRAPSPDLYFNVLRDSIEDLIRLRWPGLRYRLYVPCPTTMARAERCPGQFALDGLLRIREGGKASSVSCMDCGELYEISELLTGFGAPGQSLAVAVEQMHQQVASIAAGVKGLQGQAAEVADTVRRVNRTISTEVMDCPRLFTLGRKPSSRLGRVMASRYHYTLTLWCEHPGYEHPWDKATYELDPSKEWFARVAPYARIALRTLQLAAPIAIAIEVASLPTSLQGDAQTRLEVMKAIVDDIPDDVLSDVGDDELPEPASQPDRLDRAEGQALRAVRQVLFQKDLAHAFGDMRRVQSPAGDLLWVCPLHYPEYDPGLPILP